MEQPELILDPPEEPKGTKTIPTLLRERYPEQGYALFFEVRDATGFAGDRTADALAMSLFPSRGLELYGFEFKASRNDWLRELKEPKKAEAICRYCDRWWIVTHKKDIVKPAELPRTWGLLVGNGATLRVAVQAPRLEPVPLERKFIAAVLRAAQKAAAVPVEKAAQEIRDQVRQEWLDKQGERDARDRTDHLRHTEERLKELQRMVDDFRDASGIDLRQHRWHLDRVGKVVDLLVRGGGRQGVADLAHELALVTERLENVAQAAREAHAELTRPTP